MQVRDHERAHGRRRLASGAAADRHPRAPDSRPASSSPTSRACSRAPRRDAAGRPRRRRDQGRAPGRRRRHARTGARRGATATRPTTSGSTATSARSRSTSTDAGRPRRSRATLAARADVLIECFRPGLMASWGLDGDTLRAAQPARSCPARSPRSAPASAAAGLPGYDFLLQAMGGLMSVTGEAGRAPAEGRRRGRRPVCGLLRGDRHPGRAGRARAHRPRAPRRGLADGLGADRAAQPGLGLGARRARCRTGAATATRASRRTRPTRRPTGRSPSPSATTGCSRACARRSGRPSWRPTSASRPTPRASRTSTSWRSAWRRRSGTQPADHWVEVLRAAGVPVGPINDVAEAWALAEELGLEAVERGRRPAAAGPAAADRRRAPARGAPPAAPRRARGRDQGVAAD